MMNALYKVFNIYLVTVIFESETKHQPKPFCFQVTWTYVDLYDSSSIAVHVLGVLPWTIGGNNFSLRLCMETDGIGRIRWNERKQTVQHSTSSEYSSRACCCIFPLGRKKRRCKNN